MSKTQVDPKLRRSIGTPALVVHYITSVLGVGILILPGTAAHQAGPLSLIAWGLLAVYSYPVALIFARLSTRHPTSRGVAEFVEYSFGPRAARTVSAFLVFTLLVGNPILGLAAARYLLNIWDPNPDMGMVFLVGFGVMAGSILFNLLGVKVSSRVQGVVLTCLVLFLVVVMAVSIPKADLSNLQPVAPHGWGSLGLAFSICFLGFIGWENAAPVAEEVIDPKRTFRKAILLSVLAVGLLYLAMAVTIVLVLPDGASEGEQIIAFATLLQVASGAQVAQVGNVVAVVLLLLTTNAWVLGTSRVVYSIARRGCLPASMAKVSKDGGVPYGALLYLIPGYGIPVLVLALTGSGETMLITATSAAFLMVFLFTFLAATKLLEGRAIRLCNLAIVVVTAAMLPFFGVSLLYAGVMLVVAFLVTIRRRPHIPDTPAGAEVHEPAVVGD